MSFWNLTIFYTVGDGGENTEVFWQGLGICANSCYEQFMRPMISTIYIDLANNMLAYFTGLLINAYYRSGSSFTGNLFNYRKNTFYLFEPLIAFKDNCEAENESSARMQYLHDLFHCRFHHHTEVSKHPGYTGHGCSNRNFCFRWE